MSFSAKSGALLSSRAARWWWRQQPSWSCFGGSWWRPILDMSYSRHFLDFQGSSIPSSMKKLVVTKLSQNFREAVTLQQDSPVPLPGDGDLLVRNRSYEKTLKMGCVQEAYMSLCTGIFNEPLH